MSQNGFIKDNSVSDRYVKDTLYFSAVSNDGVLIDQLIIEIIDSDVLS